MTSQTTENQVQAQTRSLKKRFGAVAALTLLAALCVGGTLATPIARVDADNVISFGAVDIEAVQMEHGKNEEGEDYQESPQCGWFARYAALEVA